MIAFGHAALDVCSLHDPRCARASLCRRHLFQPNKTQDGGRCDAENIGRFTDRYFVAGLPFSLTVDRNRMVVAQGADTLRRPCVSVYRAALIPIQDRGDPRVRFDPRQLANDLHEILVGYIPMCTAANLFVLPLVLFSSRPFHHHPYASPLPCATVPLHTAPL